jgi:ABC-2 type transport system permease protein
MVAQNKEFSWAADILMLNPTTQTIMDIRHNLLSPEYVPTVWTMVDNKLLCLLPYVLSALILAGHPCVPQVQRQVRGGALKP